MKIIQTVNLKKDTEVIEGIYLKKHATNYGDLLCFLCKDGEIRAIENSAHLEHSLQYGALTAGQYFLIIYKDKIALPVRLEIIPGEMSCSEICEMVERKTKYYRLFNVLELNEVVSPRHDLFPLFLYYDLLKLLD